mgnify:CR=1 FL=1
MKIRGRLATLAAGRSLRVDPHGSPAGDRESPRGVCGTRGGRVRLRRRDAVAR